MANFGLRACWVTPDWDVHFRLALVRHGEMLFSYSEILAQVSKKHAFLALQTGATTPQEWFDALLSGWPLIARRAVARCHPRDGEVLELFRTEHWGSA